LYVRLLDAKTGQLLREHVRQTPPCWRPRLRQAQTEPLAPIDLLSCLVSDELARRGERLREPRKKQAQFRDSQNTLDNFDFTVSYADQHLAQIGVRIEAIEFGRALIKL
jgi:hypothetical protein